MNNCSFLGVITHIFFEDRGVPVVKFELEIEEFRRSSSGKKERNLTYVELEAWDSAALAINKYAEEGTMMAVESVARNCNSLQEGGCGEEPLMTYFRVTSFKIIH